MPDSLMYQEDTFVVLEGHQPEQLLTKQELLAKLMDILAENTDKLPADLENLSGLQAQSQKLLDTYCQWQLSSGEYLQWYAVRLEK